MHQEYAVLCEEIPHPKCALNFSNPFELLVATVLSAQTTDKPVNMVTPELFGEYPGPAALASANPEHVESIIHSIGFHHTKAKNIIGLSYALCERFDGEVPQTMDALTSLPGVGRKSAQRLAFHILSLPEEEALKFADAIVDAKKNIHCCTICQNLTDQETCSICASPKRDQSTICVVAQPRDVLSFERSREYNGVYHVLHGVLSPMNHIGPDDIRIQELIKRVADGGITEVIMATNPDTEGEATAMYIARLLKPFDVKITRLAYGIPVGSNLEYADDATLLRALAGRMEM